MDVDAPAERRRETGRDDEAEARAAEGPRGRGVRLGEWLEQPRLLLGPHADPGVDDRETNPPAFRCRGPRRIDLEAHAARLGELDRVADQVHQDLADPRRIRAHVRRRLARDGDLEPEPLAGGVLAEQALDLAHEIGQRERHRLEHQLPRLDLREVEDVVDEAEQVLAVAPDGVDVALALRPAQPAVGEQLGVPEHRGHGRPDLMAHVRQELGLRAHRRECRIACLLELGRAALELASLLLGARPPALEQLARQVLAGDVAREAAGVHEPTVAPPDVGVDEHVADRAVPTAQLRRALADGLARREAAEDVLGDLLVDVELGDRMADVLAVAVAQELELGAVRAQEDPVGADPVEAKGRVLEEVGELPLTCLEHRLGFAAHRHVLGRAVDDQVAGREVAIDLRATVTHPADGARARDEAALAPNRLAPGVRPLEDRRQIVGMDERVQATARAHVLHGESRGPDECVGHPVEHQLALGRVPEGVCPIRRETGDGPPARLGRPQGPRGSRSRPRARPCARPHALRASRARGATSPRRDGAARRGPRGAPSTAAERARGE